MTKQSSSRASLRVLVVDDEPPARSELTYLLEQQPGIEAVAEAADGVEALQQIDSVHPHVLLLDIQMPRIDGLTLAQTLAALPQRPYVIFTTAYDEYAVQAFELNAVDYLLKPVSAARLAQSLARVRERIAAAQPPQDNLDDLLRLLGRDVHLGRVPVDHGGRIRLLDRSEIHYITTSHGETVLKTASGEYLAGLSLLELERRLGPPFLRVHKSYIVDLSCVAEVIPWFHGSYHLVLDDPNRTEIPVGRQYVKTVQKMLGLRSDS